MIHAVKIPRTIDVFNIVVTQAHLDNLALYRENDRHVFQDRGNGQLVGVWLNSTHSHFRSPHLLTRIARIVADHAIQDASGDKYGELWSSGAMSNLRDSLEPAKVPSDHVSQKAWALYFEKVLPGRTLEQGLALLELSISSNVPLFDLLEPAPLFRW